MDEKMKEQEGFEVTELEDEDLADVAGGLDANENCGCNNENCGCGDDKVFSPR